MQRNVTHRRAMNAPDEDEYSALRQYQVEWRALRSLHCNALIEGPVSATRAMLVLLEPHFRQPAVWRAPRAPLVLPGAAGALILEDVAALGKGDQARLLAWLDAGSRVQVISTAEHALFPHVVAGHFDKGLYYRLNVILLCVDFTDQPEIRALESELGA